MPTSHNRKDDEIATLFRLMSHELLGTISTEDREALALLLREEWAWREQVKFREAFAGQGIMEQVNLLLGEDTHESVLARIRRNIFDHNALIGLCVLILSMMVAVAVTHYPEKEAPMPLTLARELQLQVANGPTIPIPAVRTIAACGAFIHNDLLNRTLSFESYDLDTLDLHTLQVPAGMDYNVRLSDDTRLYLNAGTSIRFPFVFSNTKREISISGEAYFEVARDAARPFIVHVPNGAIQVLGTSFNVNTYDTSAVKVSLREGSVQLAAGGQPVLLRPGAQAILHAGNQEIQVVQRFNEKELGWIDSAYCFDNAEMHDLAPLLTKWFGIRVDVDASVAKEHFTGTIKRRAPLHTFLDKLRLISPVDISYNKDSTVLFIR
jgi:hypothetical protein